MDQQLKQRLIGVTIAVALVVIFVPMLFDKSDDKGKLATAGVPAIPEDVLEKPLELPKTAEDLAAEEQRREAEQNGDKKSGPAESSGYKIVPFNDEPPAKPMTRSSPASAQAKPAQPEQDEEAMEAEDEEQGGPATAPPSQNKAAAVQPPPVVNRLVEPSQTPPKPRAPATKPQPAVTTKTDAAQAKPKPPAPTPTAEATSAKKPALAKKPEAAKQTEPTRPPIKTVKVSRPKPATLLPDDDDEGEPIPAPAKPAKSKSQTTATSAHAPAAKKPEDAKSAEDAKAAKKPTAWVIQAGSFVNESSAKGVAEKLKQAKVPATVKTIQGEHGPIYRVQVAAERDRIRAEQTLKRAQSAGVDSYITAQH